jgi:hypothetical protein
VIAPFFPEEMRVAPRLDPDARTPPPTPRTALLVNPFYAKDPHASFGKHVLTPSLALTSIAASTPPEWSVSYWDENVVPSEAGRGVAERAFGLAMDWAFAREGHLRHGPPPADPFPQVVGITVHLTFAKRAFALARWFRDRGAKVILGGLHVLSCPDECAPHADALAVGEGVAVWGRYLRDVEAGTAKALCHGDYSLPYRDEPAPRRDLLPKNSFLTTTSLIATRGCHNRCGWAAPFSTAR